MLNRHKVLFVTKSDNIRNLLEINPHSQVIISFTLNADEVANIDLHYTDNSDNLRLARGIFNGFIIELFAAVFVVVVVAII